MKYHDENQVKIIIELQNRAHDLNQQALILLKDADILIDELKKEIGLEFIYKDNILEIEYKAIGFGQLGNRNWLVRGRKIKIIK